MCAVTASIGNAPFAAINVVSAVPFQISLFALHFIAIFRVHALHLSQSEKARNEKDNHNDANDVKHIVLLSFVNGSTSSQMPNIT
jgi:hypothetical protein